MKPQQLIQKTPLGSYEFTLNETALHVKQKKGTSRSEYDVPYLNIGFNLERKPDNQFRLAYYFSLVLIGVSTLGLLYLFLFSKEKSLTEILPLVGCLGIFGYFAARNWNNRNMEYIFLGVSSGYALEMLANSPDEETVQQFIAQVHGRIRKTHKDAFLRKASMMTRNEISKHLDWLMSIQAVTETEKVSLLNNHTGFDPTMN